MKNKRRGSLLLEVVIVISINTVLFSICAGLLGLFFKLDRSSQAALANLVTLNQMITTFRSNVNEASTIREPQEAEGKLETKLTLVFDKGQTVELEVIKGALSMNRSAQGKVVRRSLYRLKGFAFEGFARAEKHRRTYVELIITRGEKTAMRLGAVLAKTHVDADPKEHDNAQAP